jgi:hypothetical protein
MTDSIIAQIILLKKKKLTPTQIAFVVGETELKVKKILNSKFINKKKEYNYKFNVEERSNWLL